MRTDLETTHYVLIEVIGAVQANGRDYVFIEWTPVASEGVRPMLARIMIVFVTAATLSAGLTADAFAFSGGVSHVVTHPASRAAGADHSPYSGYPPAY
jgi:hypothetical protein